MEDPISFKVFTYWNGETKPEVRRFATEKRIIDNFHQLTAQLENLYPTLQGKIYSVLWKDEEGDDVIISSTDEMLIALEAMPCLVKLSVYYKEKEPKTLKTEPEESVPDSANTGGDGNIVICHACKTRVAGVRYICITCNDFDLCSKCNASGAHPQHFLVRINMPHMERALTKGAIKSSRVFLKSFINSICETKTELPQQSTDNNIQKNQAEISTERSNQKQQSEIKKIDPDSNKTLLNDHPVDLSSIQTEDMKMGQENSKILVANKVNGKFDELPTAEAKQAVPTDKVEGWTVINTGKESEPSTAQSTESAQNAATALPQPDSSSKTKTPPGKPKQATPRQPLNPKAKIESALQNMTAMGFINDGGWLTKLLESNDGNIAAVLNLLTPVNIQE